MKIFINIDEPLEYQIRDGGLSDEEDRYLVRLLDIINYGNPSITDFVMASRLALIKSKHEKMNDVILLGKKYYKSKDGTIKAGIERDGIFYAPKNDIFKNNSF